MAQSRQGQQSALMNPWLVAIGSGLIVTIVGGLIVWALTNQNVVSRSDDSGLNTGQATSAQMESPSRQPRQTPKPSASQNKSAEPPPASEQPSLPDPTVAAPSKYQGPGLQARSGYAWAPADYPVSINLSQASVTKDDPDSVAFIGLDGFSNNERVQFSSQFPDDFPGFPECDRHYGRCHLGSSADTAPGFYEADSFQTQSDWPRGTYLIYVDLVESKVTLTTSILVE